MRVWIECLVNVCVALPRKSCALPARVPAWVIFSSLYDIRCMEAGSSRCYAQGVIQEHVTSSQGATEGSIQDATKKSTRWSALLWVLTLLAVVGPFLFGLPVPGYLSGSDGNFALDLTRGYIGSLHAGVWFPRWLPEANAGFGSPVFYFYGRLPFLVAAILGAALRLGAVTALLAGFAFFRALAFFTCRTWLRGHACPRAADCGALAFVALPFAMSLNPVTRIGYAETAATAFLPLLFLALDTAMASRRRTVLPVAGMGLTFAALACTHLPQLLLAAAVTLVYAVARRSLAGVLTHLLGLGLGLLLAAASILPALGLRSSISASAWSDSPYLDVCQNLLFTSARFQLYGLYALDLELYSTWLLCAAVLLLCLWNQAGENQAGEKRDEGSWDRAPGETGRLPFALALTLVLLLLAMTGAAAPFWRHLPSLHIIQFPWRLFPSALTLTAVLLTLWVSGRERRQHLCLLVGGVLVLSQLMAAGTGAYLSDTTAAHPRLAGRIALALPVYVPWAQRDLPGNAQKRSFVPEYLPAGARRAGWYIGPGEDQLLPGAGGASVSVLPPGLAEMREPDGALHLTGTLAEPRSLVLPTFFFPDEMTLGQSAASVRLDPATGLARIDLPAGWVEVTLNHSRPLRILRDSHLAGVLGAVLLLLCLPLAWRQERKSAAATGLSTPGRSFSAPAFLS